MQAFNYLPPEQVRIYWPHIQGWLHAVPEIMLGLNEELIFEYLMTGDFKAFSLSDEDGIQMVVIAQVVQQVTRRVLRVWLAFGKNIVKFLPMSRDAFKNVAETLKCDAVVLTGRRGFVKLLKDHGWVEESVNMTFDLKEVDEKGTVQ